MYSRTVRATAAIAVTAVVACGEPTGPLELARSVIAGRYRGDWGFDLAGPRPDGLCYNWMSGKHERCPRPHLGSIRCATTVDLEVTGDSTFNGSFSVASLDLCHRDLRFEAYGPQLSMAEQGEIREGHAAERLPHPGFEGELPDVPLYGIRFLVGAGQPEDLGRLLGCAPLDDWPQWSMVGALGDAAREHQQRVATTWDETPGATYVLSAFADHGDSRQLLCQGDTVHVSNIWLVAHRSAAR